MMLINKQLFGAINGKKVYEYTLKNKNGIEISCLNYGCAINKIITPDNNGNYENIVFGFKDIAAYQANPIYAGVIVGRVAGRIQGAQFELDGESYQLARNNGNNHIHGGVQGFNSAVWDANIIEREHETAIEFSYTSVDGEEGYPGTVDVKITYTLNDNNEFLINYLAQSDKTTLFNPTNHTYFNLSGNFKRNITEHCLKIASSKFLELTTESIPTGKMLDVTDTAFDFRTGQKISVGINSKHPQNIMVGRGYDHPFVLDRNNNQEIILHDEESGRKLIVETDEVGIVLYTGNGLAGVKGIDGQNYQDYLGLCLEIQGLPDAIHHEKFPSCILEKDQKFNTVTKYTFSVM